MSAHGSGPVLACGERFPKSSCISIDLGLAYRQALSRRVPKILTRRRRTTFHSTQHRCGRTTDVRPGWSNRDVQRGQGCSARSESQRLSQLAVSAALVLAGCAGGSAGGCRVDVRPGRRSHPRLRLVGQRRACRLIRRGDRGLQRGIPEHHDQRDLHRLPRATGRSARPRPPAAVCPMCCSSTTPTCASTRENGSCSTSIRTVADYIDIEHVRREHPRHRRSWVGSSSRCPTGYSAWANFVNDDLLAARRRRRACEGGDELGGLRRVARERDRRHQRRGLRRHRLHPAHPELRDSSCARRARTSSPRTASSASPRTSSRRSGSRAHHMRDGIAIPQQQARGDQPQVRLRRRPDGERDQLEQLPGSATSPTPVPRRARWSAPPTAKQGSKDLYPEAGLQHGHLEEHRAPRSRRDVPRLPGRTAPKPARSSARPAASPPRRRSSRVLTSRVRTSRSPTTSSRSPTESARRRPCRSSATVPSSRSSGSSARPSASVPSPWMTRSRSSSPKRTWSWARTPGRRHTHRQRIRAHRPRSTMRPCPLPVRRRAAGRGAPTRVRRSSPRATA